MINYLYKIKDENGKNLFGLLAARDLRDLKSRLRPLGGYFVTATIFDNKKLTNQHVSFDALLMFTHRLTSLIESGIPILSAINILWKQSEEKIMQMVTSRMYRYVEDGESLSVALGEFPKIFPYLYRAMIKVGEKTGSMVFILKKIVEHLEYQRQFNTRVKKALIYPCIVMVLTLMVLVGMFTFVVPTFEKVLVGLDVPLPLITKVILGISSLMTNKFFMGFVAIVIIGVILVIRQLHKIPDMAYKMDRLILRIPFVGNLLLTLSVSRFLNSLRILMGAGLPIVESLDVAQSTVMNKFIVRHITAIKEGVKQGRTLYETFRETRIFPLILVEMLGIGEKVGTVTKILENLTKHFDEEIDYKLNKMLTMIEPLLIIIVGAIILVTMLGIYMPIFSVWNKLSG